MIHRHKHEMTLKFPSIKTDNMLSGKKASGKEDLRGQNSYTEDSHVLVAYSPVANLYFECIYV